MLTNSLSRSFKQAGYTGIPVFYNRSSMLVLAYLRERYKILTFTDCVNHRFRQILFIQRKFREVRDVTEQRRTALVEHILPQQVFLTANAIVKAGTKDGRDLSIKVKNLSPSKIEFIADFFVLMAKLDFRSQFLIWFVETKLDPDAAEDA